jgi:hypothetical protein
MIQTILNQGNDAPLQDAKAFMAQLTTHFGTIMQALEENVQLRQRVAALESENAALTDTLEQWKNNDEWSSRVTYDNVVDQIASLEDASKRDDARRVFEPLLKRSQVTLQIACVQMHLAGSCLITVDGIFRNLLRRQRVLTLSRNLLAHVAGGCHSNNNLTHIFF